jgi:imidazole glycerol phosphate synthase glutamine amidotransferase subunit
MTTVTVVDYGAGNLGNARRALRALGYAERLASVAADLGDDGPILLPGVGAHGAAMDRLSGSGLADAIRSHAAAGRPIVGICLGLQLLFEGSDESRTPGLGILAGRVRRLRSGSLPLPHLGWCPVAPHGRAYYFAHSYRVVPTDPSLVTATAEWGERFPAAVRAGPLLGFQFHPERSGTAGLTLLDRALAGREPVP